MSEDIEIINQNTRIEKIKNFFSDNYKKLIGALVSILLVLFSYFGFQEYKKRQKIEILIKKGEILCRMKQFKKWRVF